MQQNPNDISFLQCVLSSWSALLGLYVPLPALNAGMISDKLNIDLIFFIFSVIILCRAYDFKMICKFSKYSNFMFFYLE